MANWVWIPRDQEAQKNAVLDGPTVNACSELPRKPNQPAEACANKSTRDSGTCTSGYGTIGLAHCLSIDWGVAALAREVLPWLRITCAMLVGDLNHITCVEHANVCRSCRSRR